MIQEREALQSGVARREDENLCTEEALDSANSSTETGE